METGKRLALPRTGVGTLKLVDGLQLPEERGITQSAWQTAEKGCPKRVVIRSDGILVDQRGPTQAAGWPCAVNEVRYTIGGLLKKVLIDAIGQSALTVWAESVEVTPVWDNRRIERLAALDLDAEPCREQQVGSGINSNQGVGDTGAADARYLDVINVDETTGENPNELEWSIHPIPEGARGLRFLDTLVSGAMESVPGLTTIIAWSSDTFSNYPTGVVQLNTNGATDTSILIAPPLARFLFLAFPADTISTFDIPSFIEWIIAPATLPGY